MWNIIKQKIKEQFMGVVYYALGLLAYTWLMIGMFPSMQSFNIDELMKQMPDEMLKFFGGAEGMQYSKIEGFLSIEYLSIFFVLIITFYLAATVGGAIAGNIEKKLIDFDLSQPISRTIYALSQFLVAMFYTMMLVLFNMIAIFILCKAYNIPINNEGLLALFTQATLLFWALIGISAFLSSILKTKISVVLITVAYALGSYVFFSLTNIFDKLKDFKFISIYNFYDPKKILESGDLKLEQLIYLFLIFAIGTILSITIFNKKDI